MKLKIVKLNNLPAPDANGKYEADCIYLVKNASGIVHTLYTSPDGTMVGGTMVPSNVLVITDTVPEVGQTSALFWFNSATEKLSVRHLTEGVWHWVNITGESTVFNPSDMLLVSTEAPALPSSKVFWFNPSVGGGLHIQIDENGSTVWKQTDFLDETVLQQKVDQAAASALLAESHAVSASDAADVSIMKSGEASAHAQAAAAKLAEAIQQVALATQAVLDAQTAAAAAAQEAVQADDYKVQAGMSAATAETLKQQTEQLKQDVVALIAGIQMPDISAALLKENNLSDLTDAGIARGHLGLGGLAELNAITAAHVEAALGYVAADAAVIGDIQTALDAILGPVTTPGTGGGGGEVPA